MSQRLGGKDCREPISYQPGWRDTRKPCQGRDLDVDGKQIPCEHNGFFGVPFKDLPREGRSLNGSSIPSSAYYTAASLGSANSKLMRDTRKPWRAPKLTAEGKPFEPELGEVGSYVVWSDRDGTRHLGQVWAKAPKAKHVWIVMSSGEAECVSVADFVTS